MIKKLLSYLMPIQETIIPSNVSEQLEVTWNNGKLVLDTKHTNYSFGSLEKILRKALYKIGINTILDMQHILVLGVAGGSVIKTLREEMHFKNKITGVEIDPVVIKVAEKYFGLKKYQKVSIIIADANDFVSNTNQIFDLIIIDIFEDCFMPDFLYTSDFISHTKNILKPKGYILFNTIILNKNSQDKNQTYKKHFESSKFTVDSFPIINDKNEVFIIKKEFE